MMSDPSRSVAAACGAAALILFNLDGTALAQAPAPTPAPAATPAPTASPAPAQTQAPSAGNITALPSISVTAPHVVQVRRRPKARVVTTQRSNAPATTPQTEQQILAGRSDKLDEARQTIDAPLGATSHRIDHQAIEAMPQGNNATLDKVLLQFPGVTQDAAASGELHVRNEHANLQYRINGIMLPDGVGAFGQILDTGIVGSLALLTGALPAQYGLRTAGVLDIQTRTDAFNNSGKVSVYGGSHGTITPFVEYGGTVGQTQYFASGRFLQNNLGIENPTPSNNAIHDRTSQEKGFLYLSTVLDPTSRLTFMSGVSNATYQIPNNPGQTPSFTAFGTSNFDSTFLNEHQNEFNQFNVVAYQKSVEDIDFQVSYFNRYSQLHFYPDPIGDLVFNGVSSDVYRQSLVNGIQEDTAWRVGFAHTLRFGFSVSAERSLVNNISTVLPVDPATGNQVDPVTGNPFGPPFTVDRYPLLLFYHPLNIYRKRVIKQADVVLAMFLLGDAFSPEMKKRNFDFYDPLTTGDSSLSSCVEAIIAAQIGDMDKAIRYGMAALLMDLADVGGNVKDGCHIASMGGTWMMLTYGFGGMR